MLMQLNARTRKRSYSFCWLPMVGIPIPEVKHCSDFKLQDPYYIHNTNERHKSDLFRKDPKQHSKNCWVFPS